MACYLNNTATASGGTAVGKDPRARSGDRERLSVAGAVHEHGFTAANVQHFVTTKRAWQLAWDGLTNTQWVTNIKAFITANAQLYWQGPEMSAKVAVIADEPEAEMVMLAGDAASAPHWNVTLTIREV